MADVWICLEDAAFKEGYIRVLGRWLNQARLYQDDEDEAGELFTGFYTAIENVLTQVQDVVFWQYLPETPKKVIT